MAFTFEVPHIILVILVSSYLKTLTATFNEMTNTTLDEMKPLADGTTVVPLKKYIMQLMQDIISKVSVFDSTGIVLRMSVCYHTIQYIDRWPLALIFLKFGQLIHWE